MQQVVNILMWNPKSFFFVQIFDLNESAKWVHKHQSFVLKLFELFRHLRLTVMSEPGELGPPHILQISYLLPAPKHFFHIPASLNRLCVGVRPTLNLKKMRPLQFCLPVFIGIHRNPNKKKFPIPMRGLWNNPIFSLLSTWICTWMEPETNLG